MYGQDGSVADYREMLRVKVRSLAEEARIIRRYEKKLRKATQWLKTKNRSNGIHHGLQLHRRIELRREARCANLALGLIKGRGYREMERSCYEMPNVDKVLRLCRQYGPPGWNGPPNLEVEVRAAWLEQKRRVAERTANTADTKGAAPPPPGTGGKDDG